MRKPVFIATCLLTALALLGWWYMVRQQPHSKAEPPQGVGDEDPRLTRASPYLNVRPEVRYVGDAACADCHAKESETYRHHPMGRALSPVSNPELHENYARDVHNPFERFGFEFSIKREGARVIHKETRRDPMGTVVSALAAEVQFALGSGERGRSYLINRAGYLFQSPVSWYSQKGIWDLAPGFAAHTHADRQIESGCLFCHCNHVEPVPRTLNRYREPIFQGFVIGCERCHGPGQLHVELRQQSKPIDGIDYTIVNPRNLEPALREAICQQCHFHGEVRILRRGRETFDFRPGLPLYRFWSVFIRRAGAADDNKAVSQVEQMYASRCFRASQGRLGCISCHDPHVKPGSAAKVAYFRDRCLACHKDQSCSLPESVRLRANAKDDCAACHMPRADSSDIAHTALSDHRILRKPGASAEAAAPGFMSRTEAPLIHFDQEILDLPQEETARDLALALIHVARLHAQPRQMLAGLALPLLESAAQSWPDDVPALENRACALSMVGRLPESLTAFEALLAKSPRDELTLVDAAALAQALGKTEQAIDFWSRAAQVNPWPSNYHVQLAGLLAKKERWVDAESESRLALRVNPASVDARIVLVACRARAGDRDGARAELEVVLALDPQNADAFRRWFSTQVPH